ncbi:GtrA family protein [Halegenticoccus tardaugens]|uniref:GtrA family protein n=1 Tax=Halegenticoccus tardaugens TaxID=2071624 RepID=UPI00100BF7CD|nr:GtrA family protein [Halegenticoccus tardaugens]
MSPELPRLDRCVDDRRIARLLRFFSVGSVAAGLQTVLLWFFVDVAGLYYLVGAVVAIEITIVAQYVANNVWTFKRVRHATRGEYLTGLFRTNLVRGSAIPIQVGLLYALVAWGGLEYLVANGGAIFVSGFYRYLLDTRWTWGA